MVEGEIFTHIEGEINVGQGVVWMGSMRYKHNTSIFICKVYLYLQFIERHVKNKKVIDFIWEEGEG